MLCPLGMTAGKKSLLKSHWLWIIVAHTDFVLLSLFFFQVNLFSGALFIRLALGWNLYLAILLMLGMTCLCTITGQIGLIVIWCLHM